MGGQFSSAKSANEAVVGLRLFRYALWTRLHIVHGVYVLRQCSQMLENFAAVLTVVTKVLLSMDTL